MFQRPLELANRVNRSTNSSTLAEPDRSRKLEKPDYASGYEMTYITFSPTLSAVDNDGRRGDRSRHRRRSSKRFADRFSQQWEYLSKVGKKKGAVDLLIEFI